RRRSSRIGDAAIQFRSSRLRRRRDVLVYDSRMNGATMNAEPTEHAWFDKLTMSAHPEPVEGSELRVQRSWRPLMAIVGVALLHAAIFLAYQKPDWYTKWDD